MRVAVVSTIQGNLPALRATLAAIDELDVPVDRTVCAGDVVGRGPYPNEVIQLLTERGIETVLGNYDDAVVFDRDSAGMDFADQASEQADLEAIEWTRRALSPESERFLRGLPSDLRLSPRGTGVRVQRDAADSRADDYKKSFFVRALAGGLVRPQVRLAKHAVVVHGSPRALNELVRESTASSILGTIVRNLETDVLVTAHAESSFRRDAHGVAFVGVGPVSRAGIPVAEFAVLDMGDSVAVEFHTVPYDIGEHTEAMQAAGLEERPVYL